MFAIYFTGVGHADEVQFFFPWTNELGVMFPYIDASSTDYKTSINIIKTWTSFAANGYVKLECLVNDNNK